MKTSWIIQSTGINMQFFEEIYKTLSRLSYEVNDIGVIHNKKLITNLEEVLIPNRKFITRGGTKILTLLNEISHLKEVNKFLTEEQYNNSDNYIQLLKDSIDYSIEKFDQYNYKELELPLLNNSAEYIKIKDSLDKKFSEDMFIKPSRDLKAFNGGVIKAGTSIEEFITSGPHQLFYKDEIAVIGKLKQIYSEYRFFIVDGEVITGSLYMQGQRLFLSDNIPSNIMNKAKEYAKLYSPADIFVMDLAETDKGIFIIEYNCWNCSGVYASNLMKLFHTINEFKS